MSVAVAFLLDEHVPASVVGALAGIEPAIRVRLVGQDDDVPPKRTPDPQLLTFAEDNGFALVTFDNETMPDHVAAHLAAGRHTWGVFIFPNGNDLSAGRIADQLVMIWAASERDEWIDRYEYLPFRPDSARGH